MELRRDIIDRLKEWKESNDRKPLIIQGARQVGKTWVMKKFGEEYFRYTAYFNFEALPELCADFQATKDPRRLLEILRLYTAVPIEAENTLIVFDEIQESNAALNSLKYFFEIMPEYYIVAAGSLLGVSLSHGESFPVGKVDFLRLYPVSFRETLRYAAPDIWQFLENIPEITPLPAVISGRLETLYRQYKISGGMPRAVAAMLSGRSIGEVEKIQEDILQAYTLDFAKHAPASTVPRIAAIWNSIPSQLARENRKFLYRLVRTGARAREYEDALLWLEHAGLIYRIFCCTKPGLPLSAYDDLSAFKIYLFDSGLLRVSAQLPADIFNTDNSIFQEFKGALAENTVLQSLIPQLKVQPRYWTSEGKAEVDFIIQRTLAVLPIEVKAASNTLSRSLSVYVNKYSPAVSVIFSTRPLALSDGVLYVPLYLADWLTRLLELAVIPTER